MVWSLSPPHIFHTNRFRSHNPSRSVSHRWHSVDSSCSLSESKSSLTKFDSNSEQRKSSEIKLNIFHQSGDSAAFSTRGIFFDKVGEMRRIWCATISPTLCDEKISVSSIFRNFSATIFIKLFGESGNSKKSRKTYMFFCDFTKFGNILNITKITSLNSIHFLIHQNLTILAYMGKIHLRIVYK